MPLLPVVVELFIDAAWVDVTDYVKARAPVSITRGRANEAGQVDPSRLSLQVDNRDGRFSPRNPTGIYYGKISRNTPIRVRITGETDARFVGEVGEWPQQWDDSESDVWVPLEAAGIMRRLGQGATPLKSAPFRYITTNDPYAYWPLEDGPLTKTSPPYIGKNPFVSLPGAALPVLFGEGDLGPWLPPGAQGETSTSNTAMRVNVGMAGDSMEWAVDLILWHDLAGTVLEVNGDAAATVADPRYTWRITTRGDPEHDLEVEFNEDDGTPTDTTLATSGALAAFSDGQPHHLRLRVNQSGSSAAWAVHIDGVSVLSGTRASTTNQAIAHISIRTWGAEGKASYGHVVVWSNVDGGAIPSVTEAADASLGHPGEAAGRRIERLCAEEGVTFASVGDLDDTEGLGPQHADTFGDIVQEAADVDMGILYETRTALGLTYRTRQSLYNQAAVLTLNYPDKVFASVPTPVDDDQLIRNDVTATRRDGSSHTAVDEDGPVGVDAVGRYDHAVTVNVAGDGTMLENQAGWRLHLGTVDEARYPTVHVNTISPGVIAGIEAALIDADIGDRIDLTNLPAWLPPDDSSQLVQGFTETFDDGGYSRHITINCVPESPYRVAEYESAVSATGWKYDTGSSVLSSDVTTTGTSLSVATANGQALWTAVDAEDGFQIVIGGEVMTVTDVSGASSPQTFTVTRSVNGVVKAHSTSAKVRLWQRPVYAL